MRPPRPADAAGAPATGTPAPEQPLEASTGTGPSTGGPAAGPTVVDPSDRHAEASETVKDASTGDQGDNPGMQATPSPAPDQARPDQAAPSEGEEPRDSTE